MTIPRFVIFAEGTYFKMLTDYYGVFFIKIVSGFFHNIISSAILWFSLVMGNSSHLFYLLIRQQIFKTVR